MDHSRKQKLISVLNNQYFGLGELSDKSLKLFDQALTHRSFANEQKHKGNEYYDYERLEFLGNFVLGLVVSEYLYRKFELSEGEMTKRMVIVSDKKLAEVIQRKKVGLNQRTIRLGKNQVGLKKELEGSIIASAFEGLVGAIYLDKGIRRAKKVVLAILSDEISNLDINANYIGILQELIQKKKMGELSYIEHRVAGPDHKPTFQAVVKIAGKKYGKGTGKSKKTAKMAAANATLKRLKTKKK